MGIPTRFESNAPDVIGLAQDTFGAWADVPACAPPDDPVVVRIDVDAEPGGRPTASVPVRHLTERRRLTVTAPGVRGAADADTRRAYARVSRAAVDDQERFRYEVLEALALFIICHQDRQPLHAAAIARDDAVLLLVGPAGAGKSTLTYAAMRAGHQVLAEDTVWLQLRPAFRVWGLVQRIRVPADAGRHFGELADRPPTLVASGELKIVAPVERRRRPRLPWALCAQVCVVERTRTPTPTLRRASPTEVRSALLPSEPGFDRFGDTIGPAIDALAAPGGWRLTASTRPAEALPLLEAMLTELATRAG